MCAKRLIQLLFSTSWYCKRINVFFFHPWNNVHFKLVPHIYIGISNSNFKFINKKKEKRLYLRNVRRRLRAEATSWSRRTRLRTRTFLGLEEKASSLISTPFVACSHSIIERQTSNILLNTGLSWEHWKTNFATNLNYKR